LTHRKRILTWAPTGLKYRKMVFSESAGKVLDAVIFVGLVGSLFF